MSGAAAVAVELHGGPLSPMAVTRRHGAPQLVAPVVHSNSRRGDRSWSSSSAAGESSSSHARRDDEHIEHLCRTKDDFLSALRQRAVTDGARSAPRHEDARGGQQQGAQDSRTGPARAGQGNAGSQAPRGGEKKEFQHAAAGERGWPQVAMAAIAAAAAVTSGSEALMWGSSALASVALEAERQQLQGSFRAGGGADSTELGPRRRGTSTGSESGSTFSPRIPTAVPPLGHTAVSSAHSSGWHRPLSLLPGELVRCVYLRARHGFKPTSPWLSECFEAAERYLCAVSFKAPEGGPWRPPGPLPPPPANSSEQDCLRAANPGPGVSGKELFQLVWGLARLHEAHQRHAGPAPHLTQGPAGQDQDHLGGWQTQLSIARSTHTAHLPAKSPAAPRAEAPDGSMQATAQQQSATATAAVEGRAAPLAWRGPSPGFLASLESASLCVALSSCAATTVQDKDKGSGRPQQRPAASPQLVAGLPRCMVLLGLQPSRAWLDAWVRAVAQPLLARLSGHDASELVWALVRLRYRPSASWMCELVARGEQLAVERRLAPQDLATLMWACAKLRYHVGASFMHEALSAGVLLRLPHLHGQPPRLQPRDAAQIMWALASTCTGPSVPVSPPAPAVMPLGNAEAGLAAAAQPLQQQQRQQQPIAQPSSVVLRPLFPPAATVQALLTLALQPAKVGPPGSAPYPQPLNHTAPDEQRVDASLMGAAPAQGSAGPTGAAPRPSAALGAQDLACLLWSLARLRYDPGAAVRAALASALVYLVRSRQLCTRSLPLVLWALARLPGRVHPRLARALLQQAVAHGAALRPVGVAMVLMFLGKQWPFTWKERDRHTRALLRALCAPTARGAREALASSASLPAVQQDIAGLGQQPGALERGGASPAPGVQPAANAAALSAAAEPQWRWKCAAPLTCRTAAMLMWGMAQAHVRPGAHWMRTFFKASLPELCHGSDKDLYTLAAALGMLQVSPPSNWALQLGRRALQLEAQGARSQQILRAYLCRAKAAHGSL